MKRVLIIEDEMIWRSFYVTRLRGKLGTPGDIIKTVRGFGYKIEE